METKVGDSEETKNETKKVVRVDLVDKEIRSSTEVSVEPRESWDKNVDFLLSLIGFAVDLANIWRFPYLCYKNGGGAFLIPYFTVLIFGAMPLFLMELLIGQKQQCGTITVWKIVPVFKGVGMCQWLIAFYISFYYTVIIAWSVYYLCASMTSSLPWTSCNNTWNTPNCSIGPSSLDQHSPAEEYFERQVLGLDGSSGLEHMGSPRLYLVLCLLVVYVFLCVSLWRGIKSTGKVVWVTATMPYVVLTILFVRGLLLPGAFDGILYFITPDISNLNKSTVWLDAAVQIFYSVGAGFGVHLTYASYNKPKHNCYRDCIITTVVNSATSIFSGLVIFSYLGYMASSQNKHISTVAAEGPGLVFVVYPEAIATIPGSTFWSLIFFSMLILLGIDSLIGAFECLLTGLTDEVKQFVKKYRFSKEILLLTIVISSFLIALANVTNGGVYLVTLLDTYAAGFAILIGVLFEAIAVAWFYGLKQLSKDIKSIFGKDLNIYWKLCWKFVSPIILTVLLVWSFVHYENNLEFEPNTLPKYTYPTWALAIGLIISFSSVSLIPIMAVHAFVTARGSFTQKVALIISPVWEHASIQENKPIARFQKRHWIW